MFQWSCRSSLSLFRALLEAAACELLRAIAKGPSNPQTLRLCRAWVDELGDQVLGQ